MNEQMDILKMPILPLRGIVAFPQMSIFIDVGRKKSIKAIEEAIASGKNILLVSQKDLRVENPKYEDLYEIGTVASVKQVIKLQGANTKVMVEGIYRANLLNIVSDEPYYVGEMIKVEAEQPKISKIRLTALLRQTHDLFKEYCDIAPKMTTEVLTNVLAADDIEYVSDYIAQNMQIPVGDKQIILSECNSVKKIERVIKLLISEIDILRYENKIAEKMTSQLNKNQKEYYLREQLKAIQYELGEGEDVESEAEEYSRKINALKLENEISEKLLKEVKRLSKTHAGSPEANVIRTYLDACLELPWNKTTKDRIDLKTARNILDKEHYGLKKVKERIVEYLAVKKMAPDIKGPILCLVGPPGVGKTSIALSVAKALNRKIVRLSLGGVKDEADIRGHRKTYIGAMPGRIINAITTAQSKNAVIVLDEIDKLCSNYNGDPSAALLEVLDPEQNYAFRDHYIELPFDLSEIMFITTANTLETIPTPLLDRMEVIELTSYTDEEKVHIAREFLIPKELKKHGLKKSNLKISDDMIREIITGYTKESGVRLLEREIATVCRKTDVMINENGIKSFTLKKENIETILGPQKYKPDCVRLKDEIGVVSGLAWTSTGGEILEVEANAVQGSGKVELTGNLGDVMKESAKAAITYIRSRASKLGIDPDFYKNTDIHVHFPEGAIPKDGPSAGITTAIVIISALTQTPVRRDVAMTGEITLRGRVLPIGGLKEKTMAAYRNGIKTVIIPSDNESDLSEIDPTVRASLNFVLAGHMDKVILEALGIVITENDDD